MVFPEDQPSFSVTRSGCGVRFSDLHDFTVSALQYSETVQELFLDDNELTPTDMIHFATALRHGWKIRLLDLRNNPLQVQ